MYSMYCWDHNKSPPLSPGRGVSEDDNGGCGDKEPCGLSGIPSLYVGRGWSGDEDDVAADTKTIWGQVDMQNNALVPLLRRWVRKLTRHCGR